MNFENSFFILTILVELSYISFISRNLFSLSKSLDSEVLYFILYFARFFLFLFCFCFLFLHLTGMREMVSARDIVSSIISAANRKIQRRRKGHDEQESEDHEDEKVTNHFHC